jgi:major membrane immunogen (membrane-anchored lipoprotein)
MKKHAFVIAAAVVLTACSSNPKKILIYAKGSATVDKGAKTITLKDGPGQAEESVEYNSADKITLQLKGESGSTAIDIPENGLYILNAKNDTLIGSYQKYGTQKTTADTISQEMIKHSIDSLVQLTEGKNISEANRNFYILPKTAAKITTNMDAFVVGPFHQMTSIEKQGDKEPEVYRFYSIKEIREKIEKQKALTVAPKK